MHLFVLTDRASGAKGLLPSLEFLAHTLDEVPLDPGRVTGLQHVDVVVVDATGDLREAMSVCRRVTTHELRCPLLLVAGEASLAALKVTWGFDDWMLPGVSPGELETRLRLVADRAARDASEPTAEVGDLVVDEDSYQVRLRGRPLDLTYKEFELIKAMAGHPNRVFTRELLLQEVWGYDYYGGSRTVDVHVRRLRAKFGPEHEQLIQTVRGVGYKLVHPRPRADAPGDDRDD
ncbi:response regulator transcription factor [Nitriliruptoria bacterium AS10]|nr:response regulator transcription factor [Salsipaludibacter albus]